MRWFLILAVLVLPTSVSASPFEIRVTIWPHFSPLPDPTPVHQRWFYHPTTPRPLPGIIGRNDVVYVTARRQQWQRRTQPVTVKQWESTPFIESFDESASPPFNGDTPNYRVLRTVTVIATAYNSRKNQTDGTPWRTANSRLVRDSDIACNFLPLGTLVRIVDGPDLVRGKICRVEDRLADPPPEGWNQIDIWTHRVSDALAFGKQKLTLQVLGDPIGEAPH